MLQLSGKGYEVACAGTLSEATHLLRTKNISLLILDWRRGDSSTDPRLGLSVLLGARELKPSIPAVAINDFVGDFEYLCSDAFLHGADAFHPFLLSAGFFCLLSRLLRRTNTGFATDTTDRILTLKELESQYVQDILTRERNNLTRAAEKLGVHRQTVASIIASRSIAKKPACYEGQTERKEDAWQRQLFFTISDN